MFNDEGIRIVGGWKAVAGAGGDGIDCNEMLDCEGGAVDALGARCIFSAIICDNGIWYLQ